MIYATIGTPRTKYGYIDGWLVRGSYHVRDGLLKDGTGKVVAGGNQFSRGWAEWLTPEKAKEIQKLILTSRQNSASSDLPPPTSGV